MTCSVTSKEDHGYIMDIGSNTVRGFVPSKTMAKAGCDGEVGSVMWCVVTRYGDVKIMLSTTNMMLLQGRGGGKDIVTSGWQGVVSTLLGANCAQHVPWHQSQGDCR